MSLLTTKSTKAKTVVLEAKNVSVIRSQRAIVNQVSLQLKAGEVTCIIGPNGAGKSTLVKALTGELTTDLGDIQLHTQPLHQYSPSDLSRERAVLPQQSSLQFDFSVEQVVMLGRSPFQHNSCSETDTKIVEDSLERMDILALKERLYTSLSGGEKQRTQLARVLAQAAGSNSQPCALLMMDEPTSALDIRHQIDLLKIAQAEAQRGLAVLTILHDLNLAAQWSDQIVMMKNGQIVHHGSPASTMTSDTLESVFHVAMQRIPLEGKYPFAYIPD